MNSEDNYNIVYGKRTIAHMLFYCPRRVYKIIFKNKECLKYDIYKIILKKNTFYYK